MPDLRIEAHHGGEAPPRTSRGFRLEAETSWLVVGPREALDAIAASLPRRVADRFGGTCLRLRFGNAVGRFVVPHLGELQIHSGKWHETHFEQMLAELTAIAASLPFAGHHAAAVPYDRSIAARRDVLYHAFVYLRHILSDAAPRHQRLLPALEAILREPHRRFRRERRRVDTWRARRIDTAALRSIAEGREPLARAPRARLVPGLVGRDGAARIPATVVEHFARHDLDTPENRFVKAFLAQAIAILDAIARAFADDRALGRRVRSDLRWMRAALAPCLAASLWDEVGALHHIPAASTVLQRRRGYREIFHHSHKLRLGSRIPLDETRLHDLLELKDIADLYELWAYFTVVQAMSDVLGERPIAQSAYATTARQVTVPWAHHVRWSHGIEAFYNLSFSKSRSGRRHAYSVPLRPDIALWLPTPGSPRPRHDGGFELFDAKFKLRHVTAAFSDDEDDPDATATGESKRRFKREDLYKMHTYRDALPKVRSVRILYPGEEGRFFPAGDGAGGVGALPLRPGHPEDLDALAAVLTHALGRGGLSPSSSAAPRASSPADATLADRPP